jgi:enoyl-[acyl-carrier protein] reductase II
MASELGEEDLMTPHGAAGALNTRVCRMLQIEYPVVQAGMGYIARAELAAAVSNAGGLGVVGSTGDLTPDELRAEVRAVKALTGRPFAVNLLFPTYDESPEGRALAAELQAKVEVLLAEEVPILGAGLGVPEKPVLDACHKAGTLTMATIGSVKHAVMADQAGLDLIVAQGWEAGGHNSRVASLALLPQVVAAVDVPVLAAGGIAGGSGLVAALALGASAVYLGSVFAVCREARVHDNYRDAIFGADETSTTLSRGYSGKPVRMVANEFTRYWEDHANELEPFPQQWAKNEHLVVTAVVEGKLAEGPVPIGQIVGMLDRIESAADIVARVVAEAVEVLEAGLWTRLQLTPNEF